MIEASISIFDAQGQLLDWNACFALEFKEAAGILVPGISYLDILKCGTIPERALDFKALADAEDLPVIQYINSGRSVVVKFDRSAAGHFIRGALVSKDSAKAMDEQSPLSQDDLESMRSGALRMAATILAKRNKSDADIRHQAETDGLTELPNRRNFMAVMARTLADIKRDDRGETAAVLMADLDHFKRINDSYGHAAGDAVLKRFAEILRDAGARQGDMAGRLGGEEFALLLPSATQDAGLEIANRVCRRMREEVFDLGGHPEHITVSIGVAELSARDAVPEKALERADAALYEAKNTGRDRVASQPCPGSVAAA